MLRSTNITMLAHMNQESLQRTGPPMSAYIGMTLCILMNFPIHIDTISMGLSILHFSTLDFIKFCGISVPEGLF